MNAIKRQVHAATTLAILGMLLGTSPSGFSATLNSPLQQERTRHFPQTNLDVSGAFLDMWESGRSFNDSISVNGLPLTTRHEEFSLTDGKPYQVQWFERARFELHPENGTRNGVLLGLLGVFTAEGRKDAPFKPVSDPGGTISWFSETKHTLGDASEGGQAIARFWQQKGGLAQFGYPLSQPFVEMTRETDPRVAGKSYLVQYFERQRLEYHPENKGSPYEVLLGRLGAEQKEQVPVREAILQRGTNSVDLLRLDIPVKAALLMAHSGQDFIFAGGIFNSLVKMDGSNDLVPDLAEYVPTIENGGAYFVGTGDDKRLMVKYKLKRGIKWYDGQLLDSNDVMFTYKLLITPAFRGPLSFPKIAGIDNPDPYTVIVSYRTWKEAAALIAQDRATFGTMRPFVDRKIPVTEPLYSRAADFYVLPEHILSNIAPEKILSKGYAGDYALLPWGTGPYRVTKFDPSPDQETVLEINPNYNVTPNKPLIKRIVSPPVAQTYHRLDFANIGTTNEDIIVVDVLTANFSAARALVDGGRFKLVSPLTTAYEHVDFNVQVEPFNDRRLRQAMAYALDRDAIARAVFGAQVPVFNSWIPAFNWASIDNPANAAKYPDIVSKATKYPYDPAKANQLLDQAGWTQRDANGTRVKQGKLKIRWSTTTAPFRAKVAQMAQQQLKAVGIEVTIDLRRDLFGEGPDAPLNNGSFGDYGVAEFAWSGSADDEPGGLGIFDSSQIPSEANGFIGGNIVRWSNAENDRLLRETEVGLGHNPERLKAYLQQQVIFLQELPSIPLFSAPLRFGLPDLIPARMQNFETNNETDLVNWQKWYLPKR